MKVSIETKGVIPPSRWINAGLIRCPDSHLRSSPTSACRLLPLHLWFFFKTQNSSRSHSKPARQKHNSLFTNLHDSWDTPRFWWWELSPKFRYHGTWELLAFWHSKKLFLMPLTRLLSPPLTQASGPVRRSSYWPNSQMTDDYFFPSFFAVVTVILHGWRCTSTGSILTADSFFYLKD